MNIRFVFGVTGVLLSPSPTPPVFSRWSTSLLNSAGSSPASSARSSFNHRQPYLGWRSQERLTNPRTPAERLAQGILPQLQAANKVSARQEKNLMFTWFFCHFDLIRFSQSSTVGFNLRTNWNRPSVYPSFNAIFPYLFRCKCCASQQIQNAPWKLLTSPLTSQFSLRQQTLDFKRVRESILMIV